MRELVSLEDGQDLILERVKPVGTETVIMQEAMGRVLSEDVSASINLPPFDRSPLDGYAVRSVDTVQAGSDRPVTLDVIEEVPAGSVGVKVVAKNQAVKILTGAPIPAGADAVIKFEDVEQHKNSIRVFHPVPRFANYCFAGEDISIGETVLASGSLLGPAEIGILAGLGIQTVRVFKKPRVAILSTGDELVDIHETLGQGKIYNSNLYSLAAHIRQMGGQPVCGGLVPDKPQIIADEINNILSDADMLVTTGGASVGDYDVVKDALVKAGAEILFWRVNIRPGTPVICAVKDGKLIICLSGNPAAAMVDFFLLVGPAIKRLMGMESWKNVTTTAQLQEEFLKPSPQRRFLRCYTYPEQGVLKVKLTGGHGPGSIKSMLGCNALVDIPSDSGTLGVGDTVQVILVP